MSVRCFLVECGDDGVWFRPDTGERFEKETDPLSYWAFPTGAVYFTHHNPINFYGQPMGPTPLPHLVARTPAGAHCTDCLGTDSATGWARTGEPPNITVTPSINIGPEIWHGWITNGEMTP